MNLNSSPDTAFYAKSESGHRIAPKPIGKRSKGSNFFAMARYNKSKQIRIMLSCPKVIFKRPIISVISIFN